MSKIICPKCGHEFDPDTNTIMKVAEEEVKKRLAVREKEIKHVAELEANAKVKELEAKFDALKKEKDNEIKISITKAEGEYKETIATLKGEIKNMEDKKHLEISNALNTQQEKFNRERNALNDQIAYYKDFKAKLTVKEIGESLEQYCENRFNEQRMTSFKNAYFEKDSDLSINKEKGDYIYRDYIDEEKTIELVSVMFDMKHEGDETATKHKNLDFLKKLDSDRNAKKCEYAVLVSTLEADNSFYGGITDMSYKYPKMYVVRPQCFMAFISLVKNMALKNQETKLELVQYQKQNLDTTNFEKNMQDFKDGFMKNVALSAGHFDKAIKDIDDTIAKLQKTKEELVSSMKQLNTANNKVQDLTIRKLTKNSPSIKKLFDKE